MSEIDVKAIRERAEKATPGPWVNREPLATWIDSQHCCHRGPMHVADCRGWGHLTGRGSGGHGMDEKTAMAIQDANGDFIAHARSDIPALLAELSHLSAENARMREMLTQISETGDRERARRIARSALSPDTLSQELTRG